MKTRFNSLPEMLVTRARQQPDRVALGFIKGSTDRALTYAEVAGTAHATATRLLEHVEPGQRVVLAASASHDTILMFLACQYAGLIPVVVAPPTTAQARLANRIKGIVKSARASLAIVDNAEASLRLPFVRALEVSQVLATGSSIEPLVEPSPTAFLQYTSGSTLEPRGVVVTQSSVMANADVIEVGFGHNSSSLTVNWLPMHHDMGLIGTVLHPLYAGFPAYVMAPRSFLGNPFSWLDAVSRLKASTAGSPCFGFEMCLTRITDEQLSRLDLSSLRVLFCGAEPIRVEALEWFAARFAKAGLDPRAVYPCYGLAESTLFVTGVAAGSGLVSQTRSDERETSDDVVAIHLPKRLASCGFPRGDTEVAIVEPDLHVRVEDGRVGEIWVRGSSVAGGYFENPDQTEAVFEARLQSGSGPYLRTGDLGLVRDEQLYIVGRRKDVIILDGVKYIAHDLEATCRFAGGGAVVAALATESDENTSDGQGIALWLGVDPQSASQANLVELAENIRKAVSSEFAVPISRVSVVPARALLRTSSGKIERAATLRGLQADPGLVLVEYSAQRGWRRACDIWCLKSAPRSDAPVKVFMLGAAGVGASSYAQLARALPPPLELIAIQYPGRENRAGEPALTRIEPMLDALERSFVQWAPERFVLFGHSIGGRIAIELTRRLSTRGLRPAALLLAACSEPGTIPEHAKQSYRMTPEAFLDYVHSFGALPERRASWNEAAWQSLLALMRADFELHDTAAIAPNPSLNLPGMLLFGGRDPAVLRENVAAWSSYFATPPRLLEIDGAHFFPQDNPTATARALVSMIESILPQTTIRAAENS